MKKKSIVCAVLCLALAVSAVACGQKPSTDTGVVNVYGGGATFEFAKWQGDELAYTVTTDDDGTKVDYAKLSSTAQNYPLIAEVSCDRPFAYVNFELSGTVDKEVVVTLGDNVIEIAMIGEQHVFLTDSPTIHTFKLKNRTALTALRDVYLNVDPGAFGLAAMGQIRIHRSWFSDDVPDGAVYDGLKPQKNYNFSSGASWSRCNGWFVDTGWTNMKITPTAAGGVRVRSTDNNIAKAYASVIQPIEPTADATDYTLTFTSVNDSVSDLAVLLRGGQRAWNAEGQYWDYYEAATSFYSAADWVQNEDGTYTIVYDLAKAIKAIGSNVDDDGLMIVVFIETHGNHPDQQGRDGKFELVIESTEY